MRIEFNKINFVVGRTAEENWKIIAEADKEHYWVHADGIPSSHIIIEIDEPLEIELQYACKLCRQQTKKMNASSIKFITTKVKNLKFGVKPGEVYFRDVSKVKSLDCKLIETG